MNFRNIPAHEAAFRATGIDSDGKRFVLEPATVAIPGSAEKLHVVGITRVDGDTSFFYREERTPLRTAMHFTAGYLKGDVAALTKKDNHVSVPFILARDGTLYQLFSTKYWSYHLGKGAAGGNSPMSKSAVAIEISNVGYLRKKGVDAAGVAQLIDPYGATYCTENDREAYVTLPTPFRGYTRFATFTDAQYKSLATLLRYLEAVYGIPRTLLPEAQRYDVYPDVARWKGITTHVNYQPQSYGKWDIGPAFDWSRLGAT